MDATLILPNVLPPGFKSFSRSNDRSNIRIRHRFRNRISAIGEVSAITSDPVAPQITWQIVVGSIGRYLVISSSNNQRFLRKIDESLIPGREVVDDVWNSPVVVDVGRIRWLLMMMVGVRLQGSGWGGAVHEWIFLDLRFLEAGSWAAGFRPSPAGQVLEPKPSSGDWAAH
ncbi:hypothetical protein L6452_29541 [Arctium lappa]|uniref:Uncharacterized protein n=1 Tax=Arctium lappa TaxID=4217 RepID=A0ACB8ZFY7_ARCLA|nr:hypothetical protein L6452_29541 [Arctium lappa]